LVREDPQEKEQARERIAAFEEQEATLVGEWERLRRIEAEGPLRDALVYLEASVELASRFDAESMEESHPILVGLYEQVATDARRVGEHLAARAEVLRAEAGAGITSAVETESPVRGGR
jgi:hypothetical protein